MTVQQYYALACAELEAGNPKSAESRFWELWRTRDTSLQQKYWALKGVCNAMDAQGLWTESETIFAIHNKKLELRQLELDQQQEQRKARAAANDRCLVKGIMCLLGGTGLASVLSH